MPTCDLCGQLYDGPYPVRGACATCGRFMTPPSSAIATFMVGEAMKSPIDMIEAEHRSRIADKNQLLAERLTEIDRLQKENAVLARDRALLLGYAKSHQAVKHARIGSERYWTARQRFGDAERALIDAGLLEGEV